MAGWSSRRRQGASCFWIPAMPLLFYPPLVTGTKGKVINLIATDEPREKAARLLRSAHSASLLPLPIPTHSHIPLVDCRINLSFAVPLHQVRGQQQDWRRVCSLYVEAVHHHLSSPFVPNPEFLKVTDNGTIYSILYSLSSPSASRAWNYCYIPYVCCTVW